MDSRLNYRRTLIAPWINHKSIDLFHPLRFIVLVNPGGSEAPEHGSYAQLLGEALLA